jgi:hypothetical protein
MAPILLAHAGHWLPYVAPALIVLAAVIVSSIRERRERAVAERRGSGSDEGGSGSEGT